MIHVTSHITQSAAYTSTPVKLTRGLFITSVSPGVNPNTADKSFWLFSCQTSEGNLGTVSVCLCFWVLGRLMLCEGKTLFTALCGSVMFYWTVMKFPRIINPEIWPYMSPAVRRRCPRAACLFQFTARTDIWVQTWRFISELFNGEDISLSEEMPLIHTPQVFTASTKFPVTLLVLLPEARIIINIAQL